MSDLQAYEAMMEEVQSMEDSRALKPTLPVDIIVHEALRLYDWALEDRAALEGAGMDWQLAEDLRPRAAALRHA